MPSTEGEQSAENEAAMRLLADDRDMLAGALRLIARGNLSAEQAAALAQEVLAQYDGPASEGYDPDDAGWRRKT